MKSEFMLRLEGLRLEKLIQRAIAGGASFKKVVRCGDRALTVDATQDDANKLLALSRRYCISAKILEVKGRPLYLKRFLGRITILSGIAVFFAICWIILGRIWFIDIVLTGSDPNPAANSAIAAALEEMNVTPGIPGNIDTSLLSGSLEAELEGYSYISAKKQGVRLLVEAAPETPEPNVYDIGYARDLYAVTDGIVESVEVHSGVACVQPGDVIKRGQVLIRGEEQVSAEESRGICANGEVIVRTWYEGTAELCLTETKPVLTGRSSSASWLRLMHFTFPIKDGEEYELSRNTRRHLPIVGMFLPLEIVQENREEFRKTVSETDLETLSERLCVLSLADAAINLTLNGPDACDIARSWIRYEDSDNDMLKACAVFEIYTDAVSERNALIQGG